MPQKVLFKHCDPAGIVFYPRYFEMINDCIEAWFDHLGTPFEIMHSTGFGVPTARLNTEFRSPSRHGDMLTLTLIPIRVGTSSLQLTLDAHCGEQHRFHCESTLVYVALTTGKSSPWPEVLHHAIATDLEKGQNNGA
ncbi:acyl-CoA thioesterase [Cochlodiniinecator piscidefendens]|uniref:acyl-CoA thioesterase n=1 Tax=Cochlodiniinecator piscidefendens TaxID=2715756 RepID=UPI002F4085A9